MEYVSTNNAPGAIGPYSQAVKTGNLLFTSGQIAINPATGNVEATPFPSKSSLKTALRTQFTYCDADVPQHICATFFASSSLKNLLV